MLPDFLQNPRFWGAMLALTIGGIMVLTALAVLISKIRFRWLAEITSAVVIRYKESRGSDGDTMYAAVYQYNVDDRDFEVTDEFSFNWKPYPIGSTVELLYLPNSPEQAAPWRQWSLILYAFVGEIGIVAIWLASKF